MRANSIKRFGIAAIYVMSLYLSMQLYLFTSCSRPTVSAFTSDDTGANLPREYAPWRAVNDGRAIAIGSPSSSIAAAVQRDGYFLLAAGGPRPTRGSPSQGGSKDAV